MNEICFVTGNKNKLREVQNLLTNYKIVSLDDLNFSEDIAETENTIQGNACLLYTSPSPRDLSTSRMPSSA